jgi:hypothetical protein
MPPVGVRDVRWAPPSLGDDDCFAYVARLRAQDDAFCERLRAAIEAGEESCPIGVTTQHGTKYPCRLMRAGL